MRLAVHRDKSSGLQVHETSEGWACQKDGSALRIHSSPSPPPDLDPDTSTTQGGIKHWHDGVTCGKHLTNVHGWDSAGTPTRENQLSSFTHIATEPSLKALFCLQHQVIFRDERLLPRPGFTHWKIRDCVGLGYNKQKLAYVGAKHIHSAFFTNGKMQHHWRPS